MQQKFIFSTNKYGNYRYLLPNPQAIKHGGSVESPKMIVIGASGARRLVKVASDLISLCLPTPELICT